MGTTPLGNWTNQSHLGHGLHMAASATVRLNLIISLFPSRSLNHIWFRRLITARLRAYSVVYTSAIKFSSSPVCPFLSVNPLNVFRCKCCQLLNLISNQIINKAFPAKSLSDLSDFNPCGREEEHIACARIVRKEDRHVCLCVRPHPDC